MNKILRLVIFFTAFAFYLLLLDSPKENVSGGGANHKPAGIADNKSVISSSLIK